MKVDHFYGVQARKDLRPTRKHRIAVYPGMGGLYAVSPQGETRRFDTWELGPQQVLEVKKAALAWAGVDHTDVETHDFRVSRAGRVRAGDAAAQPQAEKRALWVVDARRH